MASPKDPYLIPGIEQNVLHNKQGLADNAALALVEKRHANANFQCFLSANK